MGKMQELTAADGFKLAAYRADPAGRPKAGLVVIQEIFGVNHHIRNVADRFAAIGYAALAPALFDRAERGVDIGYDAAAVERGRNLRAAVSLDDSLKDMAAAIGSLQPAGKVVVIGYCWGGSLAFLAATRLPCLACAVGYYGGMIAAHAEEKPKVPAMLHFGEKDHGIPMTDVRKIMAARPETTVHIYPADHGFSCDERASFDRASHELALQRSLAFMDKHLAG